jgi:NADH-quinone oxidoreductase subunit E
MDNKQTLMSLPAQITAEIDHWLAKYPDDQRQSAVMAALRIVQDYNKGWLTEELIGQVADYIGMPKIAAFEVASFYSMYELKPVGQHKICVCTNISCMLCGSAEIVTHLEEKLDIKMGEVTADGFFSLKEVECLGACVGAPMFQIGTQYYENLTAEKVDGILDELKNGESS